MNHSRIENLIKRVKANEDKIKNINSIIQDYKSGCELTLSIQTVQRGCTIRISVELLEAFLVMERSSCEKDIALYNKELRKEVEA